MCSVVLDSVYDINSVIIILNNIVLIIISVVMKVLVFFVKLVVINKEVNKISVGYLLLYGIKLFVKIVIICLWGDLIIWVDIIVVVLYLNFIVIVSDCFLCVFVCLNKWFILNVMWGK